MEGYEDFMKIIKDKADQDIVSLIVKDEKRHVKMVEELIAMVNEKYKEE